MNTKRDFQRIEAKHDALVEAYAYVRNDLGVGVNKLERDGGVLYWVVKMGCRRRIEKSGTITRGLSYRLLRGQRTLHTFALENKFNR